MVLDGPATDNASKDAEGVAMKQARRWLLLAAAVACVGLLPQSAHAQRRRPQPKPPAGGAAAAPAGGAAAPAAGAAGGGGTNAAPADADADAPAPGAAAPGAAPGAPAAGGDQPADTGGGVDICQITPDAPQCTAAKQVNIAEEAKKTTHAEVYAVQQLYVLRAQRFEIMPFWSTTLNDQFVSHPGPGLALNYYITQVLAVGLNGVWYGGLNQDSDFNFQNRRAARIAVPLNDYQVAGDLNFTYVPMYGKFAGFGDFIFSYDAFIEGGVGIIRTEPIPVIDPDNRKFDWNTNINFDLGIGFRIFFTRWLAAVLEVRDIIYNEKIENINVATGSLQLPPSDPNSPLNSSNWYDNNTHITNNVQLQVGLSLFLPTSFEYHLPK
jgi:outer membrane beta-barrel protein